MGTSGHRPGLNQATSGRTLLVGVSNAEAQAPCPPVPSTLPHSSVVESKTQGKDKSRHRRREGETLVEAGRVLQATARKAPAAGPQCPGLRVLTQPAWRPGARPGTGREQAQGGMRGLSHGQQGYTVPAL